MMASVSEKGVRGQRFRADSHFRAAALRYECALNFIDFREFLADMALNRSMPLASSQGLWLLAESFPRFEVRHAPLVGLRSEA